jgi:hypothetical protein
LGNWVEKRTLDLVVFNYQVLEDGEVNGAMPAGFGAPSLPPPTPPK